MSRKTKNNEAKGIGLLQNWINKLGGREQLDAEEKATYDEYYEVLTRELTIQDIIEFLKNEIYNLHNALRRAVEAGEERKALYISARIENYQTWVDYMEAPEREKEALIEHITSSLN